MRFDEAVARRPEVDALFDPQTSGGLLIGVPAQLSEAVVARLNEAGDVSAAPIGDVRPVEHEGVLVELVESV